MAARQLARILLLMLAPLGLRAQDPALAPTASANASGPNPYGNGEETGLSYAGDSFARNVVLLGFQVDTYYDDNARGNSFQRHGDVAFGFGPTVGFRREGSKLTLALDYRPSASIFRRTQERDVFYQNLQLEADYQPSSRTELRTRGFLHYTNGIFQPPSEQFMQGLGPPGGLNETTFVPLANQFEYNARVDVVRLVSTHATLSAFVGSSERRFDRQALESENLFNTLAKDAGAGYRYRLDPNTTLGALYYLQDIRFGSATRLFVQSPLFSFARQLTPNIVVEFFGGPQHTRVHDQVPITIGPFQFLVPISRAEWHWAWGGTLVKRSEKTVLEINAQRQVRDGGGLAGPATNAFVDGSVRRRLSGRWDVVGGLQYARTSTLASGSQVGRIRGETANFSFERGLAQDLSARFGYRFVRQRSSGELVTVPQFDRNMVFVGLSYRFAEVPFGR